MPISEFPVGNGSWDSCKMFVLRELQRINDRLEKMDEKLDTIQDRMIILQVKVGLIGAAAGLLATVVVNLFIKHVL